jgi:hypothetical protein
MDRKPVPVKAPDAGECHLLRPASVAGVRIGNGRILSSTIGLKKGKRTRKNFPIGRTFPDLL